jgi:anti-anti-sigma regulatory factor
LTSTPGAGQLQPGDHVCCTFERDDHRMDATGWIVRRGIESGHKIIYLTEAVMPMALAATLETTHVATARALTTGQLRIVAATEAFLRRGVFDPDTVLAAWRDGIAQAREEGYRGLRVVADMLWAVRKVPGVERLACYEAQLNRICAAGFLTVVCLYDRRVFTAADLRELFRAHHGTAAPGDPSRWTVQLRMVHTMDPVGIRLTGEADLATRLALRAVLDGVPEDLPPGSPVTVDLTGLSFADGATAVALVRLARALPAGSRFVGTSGALATVLRLVGEGSVPGLTGRGDALEGVA